jgi:hypothetical protein
METTAAAGSWMCWLEAMNQVQRVATVGASRESRCQRWRVRMGRLVVVVAVGVSS